MFREALLAATRCFDGASDHVTAEHLYVLFMYLIADGGGSNETIDEDTALAAYVGIEALRCDPSKRRWRLSEEFCEPEWTPDMLLYVVSSLLLASHAPAHAARVNACRHVQLFIGNVHAPTGLCAPQLHVCALVLGADATDRIDWLDNDAWRAFQALEFVFARLVATSIEDDTALRNRAERHDAGLVFAPVSTFSGRATLCSFALATAHARAARRAACTMNRVIRFEFSTSERTCAMGRALGARLAVVFAEHRGDEQWEALAHAYLLRLSRGTDLEFASYCLRDARAVRTRLDAVAALWPTSVTDVITASAPECYVGDDTQVLKAAGHLCARVMPACRARPWIREYVVTARDWIARAETLCALRWHSPLVVDLGRRHGWVLLRWPDSEEEVCVRGPVACASASDSNIQLLIAIVHWMRARIRIGATRARIRDENGDIEAFLVDLARANGIARGAVA